MFKKLYFLLLCPFIYGGVQAQQAQKKTTSSANSKPISTQKWVALIDSIEILKFENEVLEFEKKQVRNKLDSVVDYQTAFYKYTNFRTQLELGNTTNFNRLDVDFVTDDNGQTTTIIFWENTTDYAVCLTLFDTGSIEVKKLYPKVYKQLVARTIQLLQKPPFPSSQVISVPNLQEFLRRTKSAKKEQATADEYLAQIKYLNETYPFSENVYTNYLAIEKKKFPDQRLPDLIDMRLKYIIYLHKQIHNATK